MLFQPNQADVRRFMCQCYRKSIVQNAPRSVLEPIEMIAALWIAEHPQYHADFADVEQAVQRNYAAHPGRSSAGSGNPFLHLAMHLSISEQCSIDQPRGLRLSVEKLTQRTDSLHAAHHVVMEYLEAMLWEAQQTQRPPDGEAYVAAVLRRATQD